MARPEDTIQIAAVRHLDWRCRELGHPILFRAGLEGLYLPKERAAYAKSVGLRRGFPDLALWIPGGHFHIEFKTPTGRLTPSQRFVIPRLREWGVEVFEVVARDGFDCVGQVNDILNEKLEPLGVAPVKLPPAPKHRG